MISLLDLSIAAQYAGRGLQTTKCEFRDNNFIDKLKYCRSLI